MFITLCNKQQLCGWLPKIQNSNGSGRGERGGTRNGFSERLADNEARTHSTNQRARSSPVVGGVETWMKFVAESRWRLVHTLDASEYIYFYIHVVPKTVKSRRTNIHKFQMEWLLQCRNLNVILKPAYHITTIKHEARFQEWRRWVGRQGTTVIIILPTPIPRKIYHRFFYQFIMEN